MRFSAFLVTVLGNELNYVLLILLRAFDFQNARFGTPVFKRIWDSHFDQGEQAYVLRIYLGAFDFQNGRFETPVLKRTCEEGRRRPYFITLSSDGMSLRSFDSPRGF